MVQQPVAQTPSACLALLNLDAISVSREPLLEITLPRYLKLSTTFYIIDGDCWVWSNRVRCTLEKHLSFPKTDRQARLFGGV